MRWMEPPFVRDVVLVGAGHTHVAVLRLFGHNPIPGVRLTLITREAKTPYSGMIPGLVAGHYASEQVHIDTRTLTRFAGARLHHDEAVGLDLAKRTVICARCPPVPYDVLSIDIGSRPNTGDVPGAADFAMPVKPIDGFIAKFDALVARILASEARMRIVLVGGGAGGVELLLSVEQRLRHEAARAGSDPSRLAFALVAGRAGILPGFPAAFKRRFEAVFAARGIDVHTGSRVSRVERGLLHLDDGGRIEADEILWTTQASPAGWLKHTGLSLDECGFLDVDANLRCAGWDNIFAAGDTVAFGPRSLPKSGVYAVRAAPVLAANIRAVLTGAPLKPYKPQREAMYLVSTGGRHAIGTRNGLTFGGRWVWLWKDRIDRRFMAKFNDLPDMAAVLDAT